MAKKILITGVTSRVGVNLFTYLLKKTDYDLWVLIRRQDNDYDLTTRLKKALLKQNNKEDFLANYQNRIHIIKGDLTKNQIGMDHSVISSLKSNGLDEVFHLATYTNRLEGNIEQLMRINISGLMQLLTLCKTFKVKTFNFISTVFVSGKKEGVFEEKKITDDEISDFNNIYEASKLIAENKVTDFCAQNNINYRIFRFGPIFDSKNYYAIETMWYYYFFKALLWIKRFNTKVFGKNYYKKHPFFFPSKQSELIFTYPEYTSEMLAAISNEKNSTYNQVYHIFNTTLKTDEFIKSIQKILQVNKIQVVETFYDLPFIEKEFFGTSHAYNERLLQKKIIKNDKSRLIEEKYNIIRESIRQNDIIKVGKQCEAYFNTDKTVNFSRLLTKEIIRLIRGY